MCTQKNAAVDCCWPCSAVDSGNNDYHCPCFNIPSGAKVKNEWTVTSTPPIFSNQLTNLCYTKPNKNVTSQNTSLYSTHHFTPHIISLRTSLHSTHHITQHITSLNSSLHTTHQFTKHITSPNTYTPLHSTHHFSGHITSHRTSLPSAHHLTQHTTSLHTSL